MTIDNSKFGENNFEIWERNMKFRKEFEILKFVKKIWNLEKIWKLGKDLEIWKRFGNFENKFENVENLEEKIGNI